MHCIKYINKSIEIAIKICAMGRIVERLQSVFLMLNHFISRAHTLIIRQANQLTK